MTANKKRTERVHFFMKGDRPGVLHPNFMYLPAFFYLNGGLQKIVWGRTLDEFWRKYGRQPTFEDDDMDRLDGIAIGILNDYVPVVGFADYLLGLKKMRYLPSRVDECGRRTREDLAEYLKKEKADDSGRKHHRRS